MKMNLRTITLSAGLALVVFGAQAGDVNVQGNLGVNSNLTAQSISLGGQTRTNWNSLPLQGYKYVTVTEGTNDVHRGNNLRVAYSTATTLGPTASNRVAVIVPPGTYNLGATGLTMNTSYVDLIGLVPAQMTSRQVFNDTAGRNHAKTVANIQCLARIYSSAGGSSGTIVQTADNVRIESVSLSNTLGGISYYPSVSGSNTVMQHVSMVSMRNSVEYGGQYVDCMCADSGFGFNGTASGVFIDCVGGLLSFAGVGTASGVFTRCAAGDSSFGSHGTASGTFMDCVGGWGSFGGGEDEDGLASGTFIDCVGGDLSYGTGSDASGTFIRCVGGYSSFGWGSASGTFTDCIALDWSFGPESASGTFTRCVAGGHSFSAYYGSASGTFIDCVGGDNCFGGDAGSASGTFIDCVAGYDSFGAYGTLATTAKLQHCKALNYSFGNFIEASDDFNYNVGGAHTFLMLPNLPTSTNSLPSGSVWNSSGTLKIVP